MNPASTRATILAGTVLFMLAGCAGNPAAQAPAPAAPVPAVPLVISARAPYEGHVSEPARKQCDMDRKVPEILRAAIGAAVLSETAPMTGRYLDLKIKEIVAVPGGGFSGPKSITVQGTLYDSGSRIGSFTARRAERLGNHVCVMLANAAAEMGGDVRAWLASPGNESRIGEMK
jgi:hypothetical protein